MRSNLDEPHSISVGVGVAGHEPLLNLLLEKLHAEPIIDEIILIVNGAVSTTLETCEKWSRLDSRIKLKNYKRRIGVNRVLNEIIRTAGGDIVIVIGADAIPAENSIKWLIKGFKDPHIGAISARQVPIRKPGIAAAIDRFMWYVLEQYKLFMNKRKRDVHLGAVMYAFRRSLVNSIPESVAEEEYLGAVILSKGFKIGYEVRSLAYFSNVDNIVDLILQRARTWSRHIKLRKLGVQAPKKFAGLHPWEQFGIIMECLRARPKALFLLILALIVEFLSIFYAMTFFRGKNWVTVRSSKKDFGVASIERLIDGNKIRGQGAR